MACNDKSQLKQLLKVELQEKLRDNSAQFGSSEKPPSNDIVTAFPGAKSASNQNGISQITPIVLEWVELLGGSEAGKQSRQPSILHIQETKE